MESSFSHTEISDNYSNFMMGMANMTIDILKLREGMWSAVASRKHTYTYYGSPDKPDTYLLEGEVTYGFKAGGEGTVKWVAKAEFEGDGPERQLRFYQVFLNAGSR